MAKTNIHLLNGPNLNLLGSREPKIYGTTSLEEIENSCQQWAARNGVALTFRQTNSEGTLIEHIHMADAQANALIINPAAYSHSSVALFDALSAVSLPKIELHLSNPHTREAFRHRSYASPAVNGIICGFGPDGYILALTAALGLTGA